MRRSAASSTPSAGAAWGHQFIPRIGQEVLVDFIEGDIDRPVITGVLYNGSHPTPDLSGAGKLPGNKTLSGIKSKEHHGGQFNELLFDDMPGEVRAKLSSEHGPYGISPPGVWGCSAFNLFVQQIRRHSRDVMILLTQQPHWMQQIIKKAMQFILFITSTTLNFVVAADHQVNLYSFLSNPKSLVGSNSKSLPLIQKKTASQ